MAVFHHARLLICRQLCMGAHSDGFSDAYCHPEGETPAPRSGARMRENAVPVQASFYDGGGGQLILDRISKLF
jgi:hypothetical protein